MNVPVIRYYLKNPQWSLEKGTPGSSGYDLRADIGTVRTMSVGERWFFSTGLHLEIPLGFEAQVRSRSGLARDYGVHVLNAPGTVDSDYRGEVMVTLMNSGQSHKEILPGDKIAQLVFAPVMSENIDDDGPWLVTPLRLIRVGDLSVLGDTSRGCSGHGSTGR